MATEVISIGNADYSRYLRSTDYNISKNQVPSFISFEREKPKTLCDTTPIGETSRIPKSTLYSVGGFFKKQYLNFGRTLKAEYNKGINPEGARQSDICLAKYSQEVAYRINRSGSCYTGVKHALLSSGIIADYADIPNYSGNPDGDDAKNATKYFDAHPEKFEKLYVKPEELKTLPAGRILVFKNDSQDVPGHIAITNGNGQGMSDFTDNLGWIDCHGKGSTVEVYKLTDGWHYNIETKKLEFEETK